jgi:hypothetical protein
MKQRQVWKRPPAGGSAASLVVFWCGAVLLAGLGSAQSTTYPSGFRNWVHVKSALVTSAHPAAQSEGGLHHIYANPKAMEGYASGQFADGSVIVYELLETQEKDGVISEGARRKLDLMVKDSARYQSTGGWGFQRFPGAGETTGVLQAPAASVCFDCHSRAKEHGLVFSRMR